jgi:hypothetical protein
MGLIHDREGYVLTALDVDDVNERRALHGAARLAADARHGVVHGSPDPTGRTDRRVLGLVD